MTVYNGEQTIGRALQALIAQDCDQYEVVVVDDGSTDTTPAILEHWARRHSMIRAVRTEHVGRAAALNIGLSLCKGKYVAINDCDDACSRERLRLQADYLDSNPEAVLVAAWAQIVDEQTCDVEVRRTPQEDHILRRRLAIGNPFIHSTVTYRKEALASVGGFNEAQVAGIDYDAIERVARIGRLACIPRVLATHYRSSKQYFRSQMAPSTRWRYGAGVAIRAARRYAWWLLPISITMYLATFLPLSGGATEWLSSIHARLVSRMSQEQ